MLSPHKRNRQTTRNWIRIRCRLPLHNHQALNFNQSATQSYNRGLPLAWDTSRCHPSVRAIIIATFCVVIIQADLVDWQSDFPVTWPSCPPNKRLSPRFPDTNYVHMYIAVFPLWNYGLWRTGNVAIIYSFWTLSLLFTFIDKITWGRTGQWIVRKRALDCDLIFRNITLCYRLQMVKDFQMDCTVV